MTPSMISPDADFFQGFFHCRRNSSAFTHAFQEVVRNLRTSVQYEMIHIGRFRPVPDGTCRHLMDFVPNATVVLHAVTSSATVLAEGTGTFCISSVSFTF